MRKERETCGVPSGIRLMNLLRERLTEIMDRERANQNSIHLYRTGAYWVAFECSAYQLYRAFPDSETMPLRLFAYPFPIVMVSVTDRSLRSYARKHILRRDESDYKLLTVPGFSLADYREWHAGEVEGLPLLTYIIHSGFISGYQNRYGDNLKPPTNVYHRMTA